MEAEKKKKAAERKEKEAERKKKAKLAEALRKKSNHYARKRELARKQAAEVQVEMSPNAFLTGCRFSKQKNYLLLFVCFVCSKGYFFQIF